MMVIYADVLLALNWWIDFLLLLGVRRTLGAGVRSWRLAVGALSGALACFVLFLPSQTVWFTMLVKLVAALVMVLIAFRWQGWLELARRTFILFALSAGLAGLCGAIYFFLAPEGFYVINGVVYYSLPPLLLVGLSVICYGLLGLSDYWMRRRAPAQRMFRITIEMDGKRVNIPCLYDSGNHLTEPFSGLPVLVVERETAEQLLAVPQSAEDIPVREGWRLIPYNTLHGGGLLPAFIPQKVMVNIKRQMRVMPVCYVAVCDCLGRGEYRGLMGSAMGEELI